MYSDADAAALYDRLNPWGPSDDCYLSWVMAASSVLDVGCGTGTLLHRARESGHTGRLCGVDPDPAALERARRRTDIEWVLATAAEMAWDQAFDLAVMASNVFQVFVTDQDLRASLAATRAALVEGGRLVFGTRNPGVRAWEGWNPSNPIDVVDHAGRELRISYQVEAGRPGAPAVPRRRRGRPVPRRRRIRGRGPLRRLVAGPVHRGEQRHRHRRPGGLAVRFRPGVTAGRVAVPRPWSDGGGQFCGCVGGPGVPRLPGAAPAA